MRKEAIRIHFLKIPMRLLKRRGGGGLFARESASSLSLTARVYNIIPLNLYFTQTLGLAAISRRSITEVLRHTRYGRADRDAQSHGKLLLLYCVSREKP